MRVLSPSKLMWQYRCLGGLPDGAVGSYFLTENIFLDRTNLGVNYNYDLVKIINLLIYTWNTVTYIKNDVFGTIDSDIIMEHFQAMSLTKKQHHNL